MAKNTKPLAGEHYFHSAIVENSNDFIGLASFDGKVLFLNAGGRRLVGVDPDEDITSKHVLDFHFEDFEALQQDVIMPKLKRVGNWSGYTQLRNRKTGAAINVFANCFFVSNPETGEPDCLGTIQHEITSQQRLMEDLRISEERLSMAVRATNDGLWDCDLEKQTVWWNDSYDKLYGERPQNTTDSWQWWIDRIHHEDRERVASSLKDAVNSSSSADERWEEEYRFKVSDGSYAYVKDRALIARNSEGVATRILGAMQNVTVLRHAQNILEASNAELESHVLERNKELSEVNRQLNDTVNELRRTEQQVIQNERLSAMGEMASGASHNLNNILTPSAVLIDVVLTDPNLSEKSRNALNLIKSSTADAEELVKRLGTLYGNANSTAAMEPLDMQSLISEIPPITTAKWRSEPRKSGSEVSIDVYLDDVPSVFGSMSDLRQVFLNLMFNAVDAMPKGGVIGLRLFQENQMVVAEVKDNGVGMTQSEQAKCLEPFFTTKHHGSGLGLSTCVAIVKRHTGSLTVQSRLGQGTTFRVELPIATANLDSSKQQPPSEPKENAASCRILYVDDAPSVRKSMAFLFEAAGHQVEVVEDGSAGILAVQENDYDIVISDFTMPGMNGREVASAVKSIRPETTVVLVTGWPLSQVAPSAGEEAKEDYILSKPFNMAKLNKVIEELER